MPRQMGRQPRLIDCQVARHFLWPPKPVSNLARANDWEVRTPHSARHGTNVTVARFLMTIFPEFQKWLYRPALYC